ncbi:ribosome silencing factor [Polyangium mundeleinium]|uniref:Ribosomal silencing factor RsfS n=1 Tax=Polyangium mundeleinium TaxID=2995306 RepID=A0ABT5EXF5_9BACT|nr:ribosome silencing factor [Polyangium mundeleinium]MDC0745510.1 ribosome silencing factor [Polyangium mundeleinium]
MATKKRSDGGGESPKPARSKTTATKTTTKTKTSKTGAARSPRDVDPGEASGERDTHVAPAVVKAAVKAAKKSARPKLRASHASGQAVRASGAAKTTKRPGLPRRKAEGELRSKAAPGVKKTPLAAPKRAAGRKAPVPETASPARELAVAMAVAGLDKKALGVEILDVRGRVDYADFLVLMTGRSDRHVGSIAQGIEEELGKKKIAPISVEGMSAATWVLLDYGDVVVHVFQEDARQLYDIEGLWMDASRVAVPEGEPGARPALQGNRAQADAGEGFGDDEVEDRTEEE